MTAVGDATRRQGKERLERWRAVLAAELVPEELPAPASTFRAGAMAALLIAAGTAATVARLPHGLALDTLWAEDGKIWIGQAMNRGRLHTLFHPYAGYANITARLIGGIAATVPVRAAAVTATTLSALTAALAAGFVYRALRGLLPATAPRLALATALVLAPYASFEVVDAATNVMWYLLPATCAALIWRPPSRRWQVAAGVVCFLAAASNALMLLLLPLLAVRLMALPWRQWGGAVIGFVAGAAVQLAVVANAPGLVPTPRPSPVDVGRVYVTRVLTASILGDGMTEWLYRHGGQAGTAVVAVAAAALLVALAWRVPSARVLIGVFCAMHLILFVEPVVLRWSSLFLPGKAADLDYASRFMITPIFLLWTAAVVAMSRASASVRKSLLPVFAAAVTCVAIACAVDFSSNGPRTLGPRWSAELAKAKAACRPGMPSTRVLVPPPNGLWYIDVPCARLGAPAGR